jgi:hypothetical protein
MRSVRNPFGNGGPRRGVAAQVLRQGSEDGFASRLELPLAWTVLEAPPSEATRAMTDQANGETLSFLLHSVDAAAAPRVADEQLDEALAPIRIKLDTIIGMLTRLSYGTVELPPRRSIDLAEREIAWVSEEPLTPAVWLRIAIYFDLAFREPIVVFAQATGSVALGGGEYRNEAALAEIAEPVIGDLARLALLVQRRQQTRRSADLRTGRSW